MTTKNPTLELTEWQVIERRIPRDKTLIARNETIFTMGNGLLSIRGSRESIGRDFSLPQTDSTASAEFFKSLELPPTEVLPCGCEKVKPSARYGIGLAGNGVSDGPFRATYINGVYEETSQPTATQSFGANTCQTECTLITVPDFTIIDVFVDGERVSVFDYRDDVSESTQPPSTNASTSIPPLRRVTLAAEGSKNYTHGIVSPTNSFPEVKDYSRVLNMRAGEIKTSFTITTQSGHQVKIESCRLVSLTQKGIAAIRFAVTLLSSKAAEVMFVSRTLIPPQNANHLNLVNTIIDHDTCPGQGIHILETRTHNSRKDVMLACHETGATSYPTKSGGHARSHHLSTSPHQHANPPNFHHHLNQSHHHHHGHALGSSNPSHSHQHHLLGAFSLVDPTSASMMEMVPKSFRVGDGVVSLSSAYLGEGSSAVFEKIAAFVAEGHLRRDDLVATVRNDLLGAVGMGYDGLLVEQREHLRNLWSEVDIKVAAPSMKELQPALRLSHLQLYMNAGQTRGTSIATKGLCRFYGGQYSWDTEIIISPYFTYNLPNISKNFIQFRIDTLPQAMERAVELGLRRGAMYPWRTINGYENWPAIGGTVPLHINADIAFAIRCYYEVTHDAEIIMKGGGLVVIATALTIIQWGSWSRGVFHIRNVTGPDEYNILVNDNYYTNIMAQHHLLYAVDLARGMLMKDVACWRHICDTLRMPNFEEDLELMRVAAEKMAFPYDATQRIHLQDASFLNKRVGYPLSQHTNLLPSTNPPTQTSVMGGAGSVAPHSKTENLLTFADSGTLRSSLGSSPPWQSGAHVAAPFGAPLATAPIDYNHPVTIYRHRICKISDIILAQILFTDRFTKDEKLANFNFYESLTTHDVSASWSTFSIMAAHLGLRAKAFDYFRKSLMVDLEDIVGNTADSQHIVSLAGSWACVVKGFGGMRVSDGHLHFNPWLPDGWTGYSFKVKFAKSTVVVSVSRCNVVYNLSQGTRLMIGHAGSTNVHLIRGKPVTIKLSKDIRSFEFDAVVIDLNSIIHNVEEDHFLAWKEVIDELLRQHRATQIEALKIKWQDFLRDAEINASTKGGILSSGDRASSGTMDVHSPTYSAIGSGGSGPVSASSNPPVSHPTSSHQGVLESITNLRYVTDLHNGLPFKFREPSICFSYEAYLTYIRNHPHLFGKQYTGLHNYLQTVGIDVAEPQFQTSALDIPIPPFVTSGFELEYGSPNDPAGYSTLHALANKKFEVFREMIEARGGPTVVKGARELIDDLRKNGIAVGCVSSSRNGEWLARQAGVGHLFDVFMDGKGVWSVPRENQVDAVAPVFIPFNNEGYTIAAPDTPNSKALNPSLAPPVPLIDLDGVQSAISPGQPPREGHVGGSSAPDRAVGHFPNAEPDLDDAAQGANDDDEGGNKTIHQIEWLPDLKFFEKCAQLMDSPKTKSVVIIDSVRDVAISAFTEYALTMCTNGDNSTQHEMSLKGVLSLNKDLSLITTDAIDQTLASKRAAAGDAAQALLRMTNVVAAAGALSAGVRSSSTFPSRSIMSGEQLSPQMGAQELSTLSAIAPPYGLPPAAANFVPPTTQHRQRGTSNGPLASGFPEAITLPQMSMQEQLQAMPPSQMALHHLQRLVGGAAVVDPSEKANTVPWVPSKDRINSRSDERPSTDSLVSDFQQQFSQFHQKLKGQSSQQQTQAGPIDFPESVPLVEPRREKPQYGAMQPLPLSTDFPSSAMGFPHSVASVSATKVPSNNAYAYSFHPPRVAQHMAYNGNNTQMQEEDSFASANFASPSPLVMPSSDIGVPVHQTAPAQQGRPGYDQYGYQTVNYANTALRSKHNATMSHMSFGAHSIEPVAQYQHNAPLYNRNMLPLQREQTTTDMSNEVEMPSSAPFET